MPSPYVAIIPKPVTPPPRYGEFQQWARANYAELAQLNNDEAIARFAEFDIDCALFVRYGAECERREISDQTREHYAPGYASPLRYKRCYIRSPAEFAEMVDRKRAQRMRSSEEREAERRERERTHELKQLIAEQRRQAAEDKRYQRRQEAIENIRLWNEQGVSRREMAKRIGGRTTAALQLIREVLDT